MQELIKYLTKSLPILDFIWHLILAVTLKSINFYDLQGKKKKKKGV